MRTLTTLAVFAVVLSVPAWAQTVQGSSGTPRVLYDDITNQYFPLTDWDTGNGNSAGASDNNRSGLSDGTNYGQTNASTSSNATNNGGTLNQGGLNHGLTPTTGTTSTTTTTTTTTTTATTGTSTTGTGNGNSGATGNGNSGATGNGNGRR